MTIRVSCPECQAVANVEEQSLGRRGRCKKCGHVFALARPGGEAASALSGDASAWKGSEPSPARASASPANLPEQFGRYRIMKRLGQGGMGAVYLALDTRLDRRVALKVPFFHPADGPQAVQRFEREARAAATLDHPNLCPVFDVGEVDGIHYLTMPYIEGKPFSEAIGRDKAVSEAQAAAVARKLALALQEAHAKGVIHRDLKPANIMVNRRRDLVIMDFGLARMAGGEDGALTRTGSVLGTALYMAPEQAAGDIAAIGPACDVYALGVILFELLTGYRPFEGPWSLVIGLKNVKDPDPPSKHRPDLSPALDAICLKAIAQRPEDRYRTMAEFAGALGGFLAVANVPAPAVTPSGKATPARKPESLAAQVFAGITTEEVTSLREEKPPARPKPASAGFKPPRFLSRAWIIAAAGAAASLLLGIIIYVATDNGRIKIEVNDPNAVVKIDGKEVRVEGLGEPITLSVGEHDYLVRWGNGEFETDRFVVRRGDNEALKIEYEPKGKGLVRPPALANATDGFTPLFNGKDLTGWVTPKDKNLFTVEDGLIVGKTDGKLAKNEFLATAKPYGDFVLKASVKLRSGNSGIQFRSKRADDGTVSGPQADIGKGYWGQLYEERGRSILDSIPEAKATMLVHEDDWNNFVITARGNHVTIALNGLVVNELDDPMFDRSGIIALQVHMGPGTEVRFKDIEIKEISPISPPSPPDSNSTGWVSLFNGKDLAGWAGDVSDYEILDGAVSIKPGKRAKIYHPKIYWDFAARVEFRLSPAGNSGLAIRYPGEGDPAYSGMCEVQILDDTSPKYAGLDPRHAHGSAFGMVAAKRGPLRPPGQWNTQEVTVRGSTIKVELNGVVILDADLDQVREFMGNKPHTGKDRKGGYFGLFGVEYPVEFRRVEIKELPKDVASLPPARETLPVALATDLTNTLGMKLNLIPASEFAMGSDATDPDARDNEKVDGKKHQVRITRPLYLGTTEVTVGQFRDPESEDTAFHENCRDWARRVLVPRRRPEDGGA